MVKKYYPPTVFTILESINRKEGPCFLASNTAHKSKKYLKGCQPPSLFPYNLNPTTQPT
jgi:hypothetical protein